MPDPAGAIWYVSYGSNLSWTRFSCYLTGGTPPGARRPNRGARDPSAPRADAALTLPGQVYFAGTSAMWGGGVALYDPDLPASTLARGYLLTGEQFTDVMAQELGGAPGTVPSLPALAVGDRVEMTSGRYGTLVVGGERDGVPTATFTAPWAMADVDCSTPSLAYLATLATGLSESHGLDVKAQAAYLAAIPGAAPHWGATSLAAALG
ncbi:MAG: histone deacetylase [Actinomycetota bacterium]|nr:histone deacetylase [Actinomycetota bacterium]